MDSAEGGLLFGLWHDQHPGLRRKCRDEGVGGAAVTVRELGLLGRAETGDQARGWKVQVCRRGALVTDGVTRANGCGSADPLEFRDPVDAVVDHVPQAGQSAAGYEDAGDLGSRDVHVKPVQGMAG